jgi:hypothetical protein
VCERIVLHASFFLEWIQLAQERDQRRALVERGNTSNSKGVRGKEREREEDKWRLVRDTICNREKVIN